MGDQALVNNFITWISDSAGVSNLERNVYAKYKLIFEPKEEIKALNAELAGIKQAILKKGDEYFKALIEQKKNDPRMAHMTTHELLQHVGSRLLPETQDAVKMLNTKFPMLIEYVTGNSAKQITKKVMHADEPDLDLSAGGLKRKRKSKKKKNFASTLEKKHKKRKDKGQK